MQAEQQTNVGSRKPAAGVSSSDVPRPAQAMRRLRELTAGLEWPRRFRVRICAWLLIKIYKWEPALMAKFITERAVNIADQMLMRLMDREGLHHCHACPRRHTLYKDVVNRRYACVLHRPKKEETAAATA